jgi:hypothetical protein
LLPLLELHSDQFRWSATDRLFAAETSALLLPGKPATWWLQQLHLDDPAPQGICLRSAKTGDVRRFLLILRSVTRHGWVRAWLFRAIDVQPELFVAIYNDACRVEEGVEVLRE